LDFAAILVSATTGLNALLWLGALAMLLPKLRQTGWLGRTVGLLTIVLTASGCAILIAGVATTFGIGGFGHGAGVQITHVIAQIVGAAAALSIIAMVASGRLSREASVVIRTEEALKAAEASYRAIFDGAVDGLYRMTPAGSLIEVNPAFAKILGYGSPAECVAASSAQGFYVKPQRQAELLSRVRDEGAVYRFESEVRKRDGSSIWISESVRRVAGADGQIGRLEGMMQDVTDRRRAREELKLAAAVFDAAGDGMLVTDENEIVVSVNPAFTEATGYAPEDLVGRSIDMLDSDRHNRGVLSNMRRSLEAEGIWRGEIWVRHKNDEAQRAHLTKIAVRGTDGRITRYVSVYGDPGKRGQAEDQGRTHAHYDALTGLANRWLFQSRLGQVLVRATRARKQAAVFTIDIDHFKFVNDSLGHASGDLLIQEVARRLLGVLRKQDVVARIGGDEFGIIVPDLADTTELGEVGERIVGAMKEPFRVRDDEIFVTVSAGIAIGPRDGQDAEELIRSADTAMFHAKDQGRNNVQFFTDRLNVRAVERLKIETSLRRAIERGEFLLHYQPQIDIASRQVIGAEALIRWQHPEDGMVLPGRFIPVAEETGLIVQIGDWALREACRQIKVWQSEGAEPIRISVNLSVKQFRKPDFVESVERAIAESGIDPGFLDFELTESMVMHDVDHAIQVLKRIKALGIEISIDDFGTGYSSLNHIRRLPIDIIKIDKSFVKEVSTSAGDAEIATAIVALAHSLNLRVIAEGVETAEQLSFLRSRRCNAFQGFLASPAVSADDLARFRADWNTRAQRTIA